MTVSKRLVNKMVEQDPNLTRDDAEMCIGMVSKAIAACLADGQRVTIDGVGTLVTAPKKVRRVLSPAEGGFQMVTIRVAALREGHEI